MRYLVLPLLLAGALGGCHSPPTLPVLYEDPKADMEYLNDLARYAAEGCSGPVTEGPYVGKNFKGSKTPGSLDYSYTVEGGCSEGVKPKQTPSAPRSRGVVVVPQVHTQTYAVPVPFPVPDQRWYGYDPHRHRRW